MGSEEPHEVVGMGDAVERRRHELQLSPGEFASCAGLTPQGLIPVRNGDRKEYSDKTRHGVARALRWPLDWYDRLLAGDDPGGFPDIDHVEDDGGDDERLNELAGAIREMTEEFRALRRELRGD